MLDRLRKGDVDLVVATRYLNGNTTQGLSSGRSHISRWSNVLARRLLGVNLTDLMSGYFMIRRAIFEELAPKLSSQDFKILLDIATSARGGLRIAPTDAPLNRHGDSVQTTGTTSIHRRNIKIGLSAFGARRWVKSHGMWWPSSSISRSSARTLVAHLRTIMLASA